jgi:hypothetical protein
MIIPTNSKIIPLDPVSHETINELLDMLSSGELINIAGVDWAVESYSIDSSGCMIQLKRPNYGYLEVVASVGTFERIGCENSMNVSASVLAKMLGMDKPKDKDTQ